MPFRVTGLAHALAESEAGEARSIVTGLREFPNRPEKEIRR